MEVAAVILVLLLAIAMVPPLVRNAVTLKRDVDQRFADLSERLASEARSIVEPLLQREPDEPTH